MSSTTHPLKILFLCTGNSCRSQMAEGWTKHLKAHRIESYSAGIESHGLNPKVVQVMLEAGVDISKYHSKIVDEIIHIPFDYVITICKNAHEACPVFPGGAKIVHKGFDDPSQLVQQITGENEKMNCYRRVRDEIRDFISQLPEFLEK